MPKFILPLLFLALAACSSSKSEFGAQPPAPDRQVELPLKDRTLRLPNDLFVAVWNNQAAEALRLARQFPNFPTTKNDQGDTPLGLALKLGYRDTALALLGETTHESMHKVNYAGEGYIFLAAQSGLHEAINELADIYAKSVKAGWSDFKSIDRPTATGQTAIFAAANRRVVEVLGTQYHRDAWGVSDWSIVKHFGDFFLVFDKQDRNFLHGAAVMDHEDTIKWAAEKLCAIDPWAADTAQWHERAWSWISNEAWQVVELYTPEEAMLKVSTANLFNRLDKNHDTPLHVAVAQRKYRAMHAIFSCRWTDYDVANNQGDLALHLFLKALPDKELRQYDDDTRGAFKALLNRNTVMRSFFNRPGGRVDAYNHDGNTVLHLAAQIADPFFYQEAEFIGTRTLTDKSGMTAEERFKQKQAEVARHAR